MIRAPRSWTQEALDRGRERVRRRCPQHDDDTVIPNERCASPECLGDPTGLFLVAVGEPLDSVLVAVPEQSQELPPHASHP